MRFLLCSDLHISTSDKDYSLSVLREIVDLCKNENCLSLLFAGDVFDSWTDTEALRADFCKALETLAPRCTVYYLPGNHEQLRAPDGSSLERFDFGRVKLLSEKPWSLIRRFSEDAELLAIPFQKDYSGYREWDVPKKEKPLRILLAHGTVPGIVYTGPREDSDSVLDEELFAFFGADLAALGHIHLNTTKKNEKTVIAYPGSARVWREGETKPRKVLIASTDVLPPKPEERTLRSAGEYRIVPVYATVAGDLQYKEIQGLCSADFLQLDVTGVVEDESAVTRKLEELKTALEKKCRKLVINKNLSVLAGVSDHPLAIKFLSAWEKAATSSAADDRAYELARIKGLETIKEILESRK